MSDSNQYNLPTSCQFYQPQQDTSNAGNMGSQLLDSMGARQSCDLTSFYAAMAGKASAGPAGMFGGAEFSAQMNGLKKSGCQVMAAIVGNYLNSIYQSRCVIENDSTNTTTDVVIDQTAYLSAAGPGAGITCSGGIDINMTGSISAKAISKISSSSASTIAGITQAGLATTAQQIGKIKEGYQGTSSGAKYLQTIQDKLVQASQSSSVKNAITSVVNKYTINQKGFIESLSGAPVVSGKQCTITTNALIDLQLANIISNAYTTDLKDAISAFVSGSQGQVTAVVSAGAPDVVGDMLKNNWMYIAGAIAAVILGLFLLKFLKSKNASKMIDTVAKNPQLLKAAAFW